MNNTDKLFWKIHADCQADCDAKEIRRVIDTMPSFEQMLHKALGEVERLQTELAALRTWKTPGYSAEQLADFEESCVAPPELFIEWHWLPDVPEIPDEPPYMIRVWGCYTNTGICKPAKYSQGNGFFEFDNLGVVRPVDIRAWHYLPTEAPQKPEGQLEALEFGAMEPQKCPKCGSERIVPAHRQISNFDLDYQSLEDLGIHIPNGGEREIESEQHIGVHWCADCKHAFDSWIESNMKMAVEKCPKCGGKVAQYCDAVLKAWIVRPEVSNGE